MYNQTAHYYDKLYAFKDYRGEAVTCDPSGISGRGLWIGIKEDPKGFENP